MSFKGQPAFPIFDPIINAKLSEYAIRFRSRVAGFLRSCQVTNHHDNDQLIQETFYRLTKYVALLHHECNASLEEFLNNEERVLRQLFGTARNLTRQLHHKRNLWLKHCEALAYEQGSEIDERSVASDEVVDYEKLREQIGAWTECHRQIVELRAHGLTLQEIAVRVDLSVSWVGRILKLKRECVQRKFYGPI